MAGGEGTRLRPMTCARPKPMVELFGEPLLLRTIRLLRENGFDDICLTLRFLPGAVTDYFGGGEGLNVRIESRIEREPLGTAGSVRACADFIGGEDVLVISGDAVCDYDLRACMEYHRAKKAEATLVLAPRDDPLEFGLVVTDGDGRILRFAEKPAWDAVVTDRVNTGIYVLSPAAAASIPERGAYDFGHDLFPKLLREGRTLYGMPAEGYWCDVGSPRAYLDCCADILSGRSKLRPGGKEVRPGVWSGSPIPAGAEIEPPVWIGKNCRIEAGARLGPFTAAGDGALVRAGARLERSAVSGASVGRGAKLCGAIVGSGASIGDDAELGEDCVVGDGASVGRGAVLAKGVKLWPGLAVPEGRYAGRSVTAGAAAAGVRFGPGSTAEGAFPSELSPETAMAAGAELGKRGRVGAAFSGGETADLLAAALSCGVRAAGGEYVLTDAAFPAELSFACGLYGLDAAVFAAQEEGRAALTFFGADGLPIGRAAERKLEAAEGCAACGKTGGSSAAEGTGMAHAAAAARFAGNAGSFQVSAGGDGAERRTLAETFRRMGCTVADAPGTPRFSPLRGGFSLEARDEEGRSCAPERMAAAAALAAFEAGEPAVAAPADAPAALESIAERFGRRLLRVGSGEAEAEELWRAQRFLRDGIFAAALIAAVLARNGWTLASFMRRVPDFASAQLRVPVLCGRARAMRELREACGETAGELSGGLDFRSGRGRVTVTPCRNAEALLVRGEGADAETAAELCGEIEDRIGRLPG